MPAFAIKKEEVTSSEKRFLSVFFLGGSLPAAKVSGYISMIQSYLSRSPDKNDFIDVSLLSWQTVAWEKNMS